MYIVYIWCTVACVYDIRAPKGYVCTLYTTHALYITHTAAPRVEISPRQSREHEEEPTFTLMCSVVAEPDATVTWQFNDLPLPDDERYTFNVSRGPQEYDMTHTLVIANLMTSDAGDYRCTANNDHGNVTSEPATLRVLGKTKLVSFTD